MSCLIFTTLNKYSVAHEIVVVVDINSPSAGTPRLRVEQYLS